MIFNKFSPKQVRSMLWWKLPKINKCDALICDGSVRSGKSLSMTIGFILWSCSEFNGQTFAICGKTAGSIQRNVILPMQQWLEGVAKISLKLSRSCFDVTMNGNTNRYYFFGGKDESSYTLIQGMTLAGVMFDEVALMPKSFVDQALARCSVAGSRFWFNCNPDSPQHWFYQEWILKLEKKNAAYLHFTMDDNFSLDENVKQRYERMYSGVFYDRYIKGSWVLAEGLVYGTVFTKERHILENYTPSNNAQFYVSVDYGTQNPCSMGLWAVENNRAVRLKEYYYDGRKKGVQKADEEYYTALEKLTEGFNIQHVIIDPSAASFIATIKIHQKFSVRKARNDVLNGIRTTMNMLNNNKLFFCECCKDTIREFALYRWDDKKSHEKDTVIKENDHAMDDIRYFCYTILRRVFSGEEEQL